METIHKQIEIDSVIQDVEIRVEVTHYMHVPAWEGNPYDCPSDLDFTGYTELTYNIVDIVILTDEGEQSVNIPIDSQLESEIYSELLVRAASYREQDLDDEPLVYVKY